jgi:hypothetical protein
MFQRLSRRRALVILATLAVLTAGGYMLLAHRQNARWSRKQRSQIKVPRPSKVSPRQSDSQLWNATISPYLSGELWQQRDAYDAGFHLMVPLHAAFRMRQEKWQREFAGHAQRLVQNRHELPKGQLDRLQYLYVWSRFVVLAAQSNQEHLIPPLLIDVLYKEIYRAWQVEPAWQWAREPFAGGIRERLQWKLQTQRVDRSYYRAIIDEELFVMAIAADLRAYERLTGRRHSTSPVIIDILIAAYKAFRQESSFPKDGGWIWQVGVWSQHPDYAYAGRKRIVPGMEPSSVPGIAMDSSHSTRFPLWLTSLACAYDSSTPERRFYEYTRARLNKQFLSKVLVRPTVQFPAYRTTNFMDGSNGVYRWNYKTGGGNDGYDAYELSGTLCVGWWCFLGSKEAYSIYKDQSHSFPLSATVISTYIGPNTTRARHPLVTLPAQYYNGFSELLTRLAGRLG